MSTKQKLCVLELKKYCDGCGECNICDLDRNKICDNCMQCIDDKFDYRAITIDKVIIEDDEEVK